MEFAAWISDLLFINVDVKSPKNMLPKIWYNNYCFTNVIDLMVDTC
jgi:hypothetical protein